MVPRPDAARPAASVPRPASRWKTRVLLPAAMFASVAAVLGYAARDALRPAIDVWVTPVVVLTGERGPAPQGVQPTRVISQAPGWVQPWPYAVTVPALTPGVVKEVLVLVGDSVEAGRVLARLIDEDATLALREQDGRLAERQAELVRSRADLAAAQARAAEVADQEERTRELSERGGGSAGETSRARLRLLSAQREVDAASAALAVSEAAVQTQRAARDSARLALERTEIRAPVSGVVMARLVEPGTRLAMDGRGEGMPTAVARLYDPSSLQVRVDVPLADAAKMELGGSADVTTEALPDRTFRATIALIGHEADIQRNTVPVSVRIHDPSPVLRPDMLTRVKFTAGTAGEPGSGGSAHAGTLRLAAPTAALLSRVGDTASVWVADRAPAAGPVARLRRLTLAGDGPDATTLVVTGLSAGDRVIVDPPPGVREGSRIRVLGEKP